jgi:HAMP domain-containing protein
MKSIRSILLTGLAVMALLFLVQAGLLSWGQRIVETEVVSAVQKNTIASSQLGELAVLAQQVRRYEKEYFVYVANVERREGYIKEWTNTSDKIAKLIQAMRANADGAFTADDLGKIANWSSAAEFYSAEMKRIFFAVNERQSQIQAAAAAAPITSASGVKPSASAAVSSAIAMFPAVEVNGMIDAGKDRLSGVLVKGVSEMSAAKTKDMLALPAVTKAGFERMWNGVMASVVIGLIIAGYMALKLPSAITKPIAVLSDAIDRVSKGELDVAIDSSGPREFSTLAAAVERMRVAQRTLVARLRSRATTPTA